VIKATPKPHRLVDFCDNEGIQNDDGYVREQFQNDHFAPKVVKMLIKWIFSQSCLSNGSLVDVWKNKCFQFEKL